MKKKLTVILCLVLIMSMMTGCTTFNNFKNAFFGESGPLPTPTTSDKTIKIGVYEPLTGEYKTYGEEEKTGIELAHELYPEVLGKKVELVYGDNQGDMYVAETVIQELVSQSPAVILGSYGDTVSLVAGDAIKEAQIPAITLTSTNPLITVNNPFYFCATFVETRQGEALAEFLVNDQKKTKVASVRVEGDDLATSTINRFNKKVRALTEVNESVVANYQIGIETTDYTDTIKKIKASGARAVFLHLSAEKAQNFLKKAIELKATNIMYVGTKEWGNKDFTSFVAANKELNVAYTSDFAAEAHQTAMSDKFVKAYKAKYGQNAEPTEAMAIAFDGYIMALKAIEVAHAEVLAYDFEKMKEDGKSAEEIAAAKETWIKTQEYGIPTGDAIRAALTALENFDGASGAISFGGSTEASKTMIVNHIVGGEVQAPYTEVEAEAAGEQEADNKDVQKAAEEVAKDDE